MHYVDAGPRDAPVVLLLHGQPTWSYLYRKVIAVLTRRGLRAIAPDNIGFGRSDKPTERTDYTYGRHVEWMTSFVDVLDLSEVTLVVQDWGGPIGLGTLAARPGALRPGGGVEHRPAHLGPFAGGEADVGQPRRWRQPGGARAVPRRLRPVLPARAGAACRATSCTHRRDPSRPRCSPPTTLRSPTRRSRPVCAR